MKKYIFALAMLVGAPLLSHAVIYPSTGLYSEELCIAIKNNSYRAYLGMSDANILREAQLSPNDPSKIPNSISNLQKFLIQNKHASFANATGYYGAGTKQAVQVFQRTYGISTTGSVGPVTRAKIREVLKCDSINESLSSTVQYINKEYGFSLDLPASWKGYTAGTYEYDSTSHYFLGFNIGHPTEKIYPAEGQPYSRTYSMNIVPIATWNNPYVTEGVSQSFASHVPLFELGRNEIYVFAMRPIPVYESYDLDKAEKYKNNVIEDQAIHNSLKTFIPKSSVSMGLQNLTIPGFKIINGVAYATILEKCTDGRTVCDLSNPDILVRLVDKGLKTNGGYTIGLYMYPHANNEPVRYLVLVGKDGKWRYDYLDCKNGQYTCGFESYGSGPNSNNIYFVSTELGNKDIVYLDAERFLQSNKSQFVLNGY